MIDVLTSRAAVELARVRQTPCVSLVLPTEHGHVGAQAARLELKNLIADARDEVALSLSSLETNALLAPAEEILDDDHFWRDTANGLAIYLAPGIVRVRRVPGAVTPYVLVADRFAISPVLAALIPDESFHVLALSRNHAEVFEGSRHTMFAVKVPGLPDGIADALWFEEHDNILNRHGGAHVGFGGRPTSMVHGTVSQRDERKERQEKYFRLLDDALVAAFDGSTLPFVVAAVEREIAGFHEVSRLPHVLREGVVGNPEKLLMRELHDAAWALVERELSARRHAALDRFAEFAGTGRAVTDAAVIAAAAATGGVETLFLSADGVLSTDGADGVLSADTALSAAGAGSTDSSTERHAGDRDLINEAVTDALITGAVIHVGPIHVGPIHVGRRPTKPASNLSGEAKTSDPLAQGGHSTIAAIMRAGW
jgi:hypothetical protein